MFYKGAHGPRKLYRLVREFPGLDQELQATATNLAATMLLDKWVCPPPPTCSTVHLAVIAATTLRLGCNDMQSFENQLQVLMEYIASIFKGPGIYIALLFSFCFVMVSC
jgi:hypothetical protein